MLRTRKFNLKIIENYFLIYLRQMCSQSDKISSNQSSISQSSQNSDLIVSEKIS